MYKYIPIVRHGNNEKQVFQDFDPSKLSSGSIDVGKVQPVIEIIDEEHLHSLDDYRTFSATLFIDLPRYLINRDNKHNEAVENLVARYSGVQDFYNSNINGDIPVVSGNAESPIDYSELSSLHDRLSDDFDPLAVRVFVGGRQLDQQQLDDLEELFVQLRQDDVVLLDLIDTGGFDTRVYENLEDIVDRISGNEAHVQNAFNYRDSRHNYGPIAAQQLGIDGFGDFVINLRFPQEMNFRPATQYIRMFDSGPMELRNFGGDGYQDAFHTLRSSGHWNPNHCEFCEQIQTDRNWGPNFWKRVRMGHYISEILEEVLDDMESQPPDDLDEDGYGEIS